MTQSLDISATSLQLYIALFFSHSLSRNHINVCWNIYKYIYIVSYVMPERIESENEMSSSSRNIVLSDIAAAM